EDGIRDLTVTGVQTCALPISMIRTWNPENPHLYQAVLTLKDAAGQVIYTFTKKFGFRTVESKPDGIYCNGVKVIFKGINRRSARSEERRVGKECRARCAQ